MRRAGRRTTFRLVSPDRLSAACAAHARRNFEELAKDGTSRVGLDAIRQFARIYEVEGELKDLGDASDACIDSG
jgi:hypothetical protein